MHYRTPRRSFLALLVCAVGTSLVLHAPVSKAAEIQDTEAYPVLSDGVYSLRSWKVRKGSFEEMLRLCRVLTGQGIRKVRITGGEPLVRWGVVDFMSRVRNLPGRPEVLLTTNGVVLRRHLAAVAEAGVRRVNLSLDSLDAVKIELDFHTEASK